MWDLPDQCPGDQCLLHWQADSYPLYRHRSPDVDHLTSLYWICCNIVSVLVVWLWSMWDLSFLRRQSPHHWTGREVPLHLLFVIILRSGCYYNYFTLRKQRCREVKSLAQVHSAGCEHWWCSSSCAQNHSLQNITHRHSVSRAGFRIWLSGF